MANLKEESGRIRRLEEAVINRIAAGEVIQRPANAVKEMIENSLDAGSTSIQVVTKSGGLKMLQVQDNGCGIERDDMKIVCERFTTSKLKFFEDLYSLDTYGFRGEALASVSHVAHVTITTRTASSKCAYKAAYSDGVMVPLRSGGTSEPKLCAGNQGTVITVEDLFYNVSTRRKALKSPSDELARITDIMTKYALHNSDIGFTLKKHGATMTEIKTSPDSDVKDNVGLLYGSAVQKELIPIAAENRSMGFRMSGLATNANYSVKKFNFLLFINNRLVDSSALRKALEVTYSTFLPKNSHPFIYMSISISPENIDVNVHPTKQEVHFLHEDLIIESIQKAIEKKLLECDSSRTYYTQSLLPSSSALSASNLVEEISQEKQTEHTKIYDHKMVRTDSKEKKLEAFVLPKSITEELSTEVGGACGQAPPLRPWKAIHLTSILSLQNTVNKNRHGDLTSLFGNHTFVGCMNQTKVLIQFETGLYLLDMSRVSKELFFQLILFDFGNFGSMKLLPPAPIYEMALLAIEAPSSGWSPEDGPKEKLAQYVVEFLATKSEMLLEYFSLEIKDGCIHTLPVLLDNYTPNLDRLPTFLLCLAVEVDWTTEKNCFLTFARECATFYSIQNDPFVLTSTTCSSEVLTNTEKDPKAALRTRLIPPVNMAQDGSVLQIANLSQLYKVFERC